MIQESCQDNFRSCLRNFFPGRERKTSKICQNLSPRFSCEQSPIQLKRCFLIYIGIFFTRKNLELHTNTQWMGDAQRCPAVCSNRQIANKKAPMALCKLWPPKRIL